MESIGGQQSPPPVRKQQMSSLWTCGHKRGTKGVRCGRLWGEGGPARVAASAFDWLLVPCFSHFGWLTASPLCVCRPRGSLSGVPSILSASVLSFRYCR